MVLNLHGHFVIAIPGYFKQGFLQLQVVRQLCDKEILLI